MSELAQFLEQLAYKSLSAAERDKADAYAGPGKSFPLYKNGEHLRAAWDLAGHADNPGEIRANVLRFAREHGLTHHLPEDALHASNAVKKALVVGMLAKARTGDMQALVDMAWRHGQFDSYHKADLAHFAKQHDMLHLLPEDAHATLHNENIVHEHDGIANNDWGMHTHEVARDMVKKSFNPTTLISKAWVNDAGFMVIEGWISTPDPDLEKDIVPPEAFLTSIDGYAARGMPLSSEHNTTSYPVGHGQRAAVVRDGQILKAATHPTDAAEFEHFPNSGTGVYGRFVITEPDASGAVRKGNVRGFSFIGKPEGREPLPTGGHILNPINPWLESTIAAYPVNSQAVVTAAH